LVEQRRIVEILAAWDEAIGTIECLLANVRKQKQAFLSKVLTGKRRLGRFRSELAQIPTPHGSIPGDWTYPRIESFAHEVSQKHSGGQVYPVLSCTKHAGLVDSLSYFKKQVFSKDLSTYKVVPHACFVYATNHIEEGSIGYQDLHDYGLVSPMYTVFKTDPEIHDGYLYRLLKTEHFRQIFAAATNSSVDRRGSLRWNDFKKLHVPLPPMEEQLVIAELLDKADREIELLEAKLASFRIEKRALMQQLLTGKRRVRSREPAEIATA
jgi:Restriction endonuclease S subunits